MTACFEQIKHLNLPAEHPNTKTVSYCKKDGHSAFGILIFYQVDLLRILVSYYSVVLCEIKSRVVLTLTRILLAPLYVTVSIVSIYLLITITLMIR